MKKVVVPIVQLPHNLECGRVSGAKDAFVAIDSALSAYRVGESFQVNDGFIGMPVTLTVYNDPLALRTNAPKYGRLDDDLEPHDSNYPPDTKGVCLYLIHTALPRIGTAEDAEIIRDILARGMAVCVVDYGHDVRADVPDLEWSVQNLILRMGEGKIPLGIPTFRNNFHSLPAGYTVKLGIPYYNYRENGVLGLEDYIVDIWNNSLSRMSGRFAKGNIFRVKWGQKTDRDGNPLFDAEGEPVYKKVREGAVFIDEDERILPVGYTIAEDIWDCVRTDGSPIDLNLYIDLIYPVKPKEPVPIFTHHSSAEERHQPQPIYHGFAMRGYALVNYEHAYTPMSKRTHFGYFEGEISEGRRADFTLRYYTGMTQMTAAIRLVRKLVELYPDEYCFLPDAIGSYGGSKGAPTNILGTAHPERLVAEDFLPGYHGENNNPQPFTTYEDGREIPSDIQFAYTSNGGGGTFLFKDQCPVCVTRGEADGAFVSSSHMGLILSSLRANDTPVLDMTMPGVGHKVIHGYSEARDYDMYNALFTYAAYYLKKAPSECLYILPIDGASNVPCDTRIRVKFSGEHTKEEIERGVRVLHEDGSSVRYRLDGHFCGNEWTFTPLDLCAGERVLVEVFPTLCDKRGERIKTVRRATFTTAGNETVLPISIGNVRDAQYFTFKVQKGKECKLSFAMQGKYEKGVRFLISNGKKTNSTCTASPVDGVCSFVVPDEWIMKDGTLVIRIGKKGSGGAKVLYYPLSSLEDDNPFIAPIGGYAEPTRITPIGEIREAKCGEVCFVGPTGIKIYLDNFLPVRSKSDIGRTFRISFEARCENERMLHARAIERLGSEPYMDFYNDAALLECVHSDKWSSYQFDYTVTTLDNTLRAHRKNSIFILASSNGIRNEELCVRNLRIEEIVNDGKPDSESVRIHIQ